MASGTRNSAWVEVSNSMGSSPRVVVIAVSRMGRKRLSVASTRALRKGRCSSSFSLTVKTSEPFTTSPPSAIMPYTLTELSECPIATWPAMAPATAKGMVSMTTAACR